MYVLDGTQEIIFGLSSGKFKLGTSQQVQGAVSQHVFDRDGKLVGHAAWRPATEEEIERALKTDKLSDSDVDDSRPEESAPVGKVLLAVAQAALPIVMEVVREARNQRAAERATETVRDEFKKGNLRLIVDNTAAVEDQWNTGS